MHTLILIRAAVFIGRALTEERTPLWMLKMIYMYISTKALKERPNQDFGLPLRGFAIKSSLERLVPEPN